MADTATADPGTRPEPFALSDATGGADRPAEERGTLEIRSKALGHLVERAVGEVDGTVRSATTTQRALGRGFPRASVRLDRDRAWVDVDVAVVWPAPVAEVAQRVRDEVRARATSLSGLDVRRVDVTVHVVTESDDDSSSRRVA